MRFHFKKNILILLSIFVFNFSYAQNSIKMLWWNVAVFNVDGPVVLQTLEDVADNYDLILLGESRQTEVDKFRNTASGKDFKYVDHVNYPSNSSLVISVLSKFPIKRLKRENLNWGTDTQKANWFKKYKEEPPNSIRSFTTYEVIKDKQTYLISPIHFLNPWPFIQSVDGFVSTGFNIYFGQSNPLYFQVQEAVEKISTGGYIESDLPFILIGDYNSPSNPTAGAALGYLSNYLTNLMSDQRPTFESKGLKIDHAFGNSKVNVLHDEVLFFEGSDHYPIELEIQSN